MVAIYLELDGENVVGWGSQINNAVKIEVEENHDFFTNFRSYKLIDGQLVKGEAPTNPVEKTEIEIIKEENAVLKQQVIQQNVDMQEFMDYILTTMPQP